MTLTFGKGSELARRHERAWNTICRRDRLFLRRHQGPDLPARAHARFKQFGFYSPWMAEKKDTKEKETAQ